MNRRSLYRSIVGAHLLVYSETWAHTFTTTFVVRRRSQKHGERQQHVVIASPQGREERLPFTTLCEAIERGEIRVTYTPAL